MGKKTGDFSVNGYEYPKPGISGGSAHITPSSPPPLPKISKESLKRLNEGTGSTHIKKPK